MGLLPLALRRERRARSAPGPRLACLPLLLVLVLALGGAWPSDASQAALRQATLIADAGHDLDAVAGVPLLLDGSGSVVEEDPAGPDAQVVYWWDRDSTDGVDDHLVGSAVMTTYETVGLFITTLFVSDGVVVSSDSLLVSVEESRTAHPPVPQIHGDGLQTQLESDGGAWYVSLGQPLLLDASASWDGDRDPIAFRWEVGDGSTFDSVTFNHTFSSTGVFSIILEVDDGTEAPLGREVALAVVDPQGTDTSARPALQVHSKGPLYTFRPVLLEAEGVGTPVDAHATLTWDDRPLDGIDGLLEGSTGTLHSVIRAEPGPAPVVVTLQEPQRPLRALVVPLLTEPHPGVRLSLPSGLRATAGVPLHVAPIIELPVDAAAWDEQVEQVAWDLGDDGTFDVVQHPPWPLVLVTTPRLGIGERSGTLLVSAEVRMSYGLSAQARVTIPIDLPTLPQIPLLVEVRTDPPVVIAAVRLEIWAIGPLPQTTPMSLRYLPSAGLSLSDPLGQPLVLTDSGITRPSSMWAGAPTSEDSAQLLDVVLARSTQAGSSGLQVLLETTLEGYPLGEARSLLQLRGNAPPALTGLPTTVDGLVGEVLHLACDATDPDTDPVLVRWQSPDPRRSPPPNPSDPGDTGWVTLAEGLRLDLPLVAAGPLLLRVVAADPHGARAMAIIPVDVTAIHAILLNLAGAPPVDLQAGRPSIVPLVLANAGSGSEVVVVSLEPSAGLQASLDRSTITLSGGGQEQLLLRLSSDRASGSRNPHVLTVHASATSGAVASLQVPVRFIPTVALTLTAPAHWPAVTAGATRTVDLLVTNAGTDEVVVGFLVLGSSSAWIDAPPPQGLRPGQVAVIPLVMAPPRGLPGGWHDLTVQLRPLTPQGEVLPQAAAVLERSVHVVPPVASGPGPRVVVTGVALAALTLGIIIVGGTEFGLVALLSLLVLGYTKLRQEAVLDHFTRAQIQGFVMARPGVNYTTIKRRFSLNNGALAYHLQVLQREEYIVSRRRGKFTCYYPPNHPATKAAFHLSKLQQVLLETVEERPGMTQKQLAATIGIGTSTVNTNLHRLADLGLVHTVRAGMTTRCYLGEGTAQPRVDRGMPLPEEAPATASSTSVPAPTPLGRHDRDEA